MALLWITALVSIAISVSPAFAGSEASRATLKGLPGVCVVVDVKNIGSGEEKAVLATLQTAVEVKLRLAGVRVFTKAEWGRTPPSCPQLSLFILTDPIDKDFPGSYLYSGFLELWQGIQLMANPTVRVTAPTWRSATFLGTTGIPAQQPFSALVREIAQERADEFINAYLAANPKQ
jgi:hypothetical protein